MTKKKYIPVSNHSIQQALDSYGYTHDESYPWLYRVLCELQEKRALEPSDERGPLKTQLVFNFGEQIEMRWG